MPDSYSNSFRSAAPTPVDVEAEAWVRRIQAGLSGDEEFEFADWLSHPGHESAYQRYAANWNRIELAAPILRASPDLAEIATAPMRSRRRAYLQWVMPLAAAAALALVWHTSTSESDIAFALPAQCEQRTLPDGSVVELNRGTDVAVTYTSTERRIELLRGEANFTVARDPAKPFIVSAGKVHVRALGTVFNVRYDPAAVEVVVSEGKVEVADADPAEARKREATPTFLGAGQKTVVNLAYNSAPAVQTLSPQDLEHLLLWQPKLLDFDNVPLSQVVAEFNRRNPVKITIADSSLGARRITATFRSDNLETFVRMVESNLRARLRWETDREIVFSGP